MRLCLCVCIIDECEDRVFYPLLGNGDYSNDALQPGTKARTCN